MFKENAWCQRKINDKIIAGFSNQTQIVVGKIGFFLEWEKVVWKQNWRYVLIIGKIRNIKKIVLSSNWYLLEKESGTEFWTSSSQFNA